MADLLGARVANKPAETPAVDADAAHNDEGELGVANMTYQTRAAVTEATLMVFRPIQGVAIRSHTAATRRYIGRIRKLLELIATQQ